MWMVIMRRGTDWTLRSIDLAGGAVVAALLVAAFWLFFVEGERTDRQIQALTELLHHGEQDRDSLRAAEQKQDRVLAERQRELTETGQLPDRPPMETYFQFLSRRATHHGLTVLRHQPIAERRYTGLIEHCFAYEIRGAYAPIVAFLQDVERSEHWADVGYLKIDRGALVNAARADGRTAQLTVSLFSAPPRENGAKGGA